MGHEVSNPEKAPSTSSTPERTPIPGDIMDLEGTPIPGDITDVASSYAGNFNLFRPWTKNAELASRDSLLGSALLRHVKNGKRYDNDKEYGNEYYAIAMLSRYPDLIRYKADVTDEFGYTHKAVNALELALKLPKHTELALSMYKTLCEAYQDRHEERKDLTEIFHAGFREHVAKGNQDAAEAMLEQYPELLKFEGSVTDYSGRTFHCTAYEYAYWAKDTYMCRMLENHMDNEVKAQTLTRIKRMEESGLAYTQHSKEYRSPHFDLTPLINALQHYIDEHNQRPNKSDEDWKLLHKILREEVGGAQRDVPAHIAQEYCHPDRSFLNLLDLEKPSKHLKRSLRFYNPLIDQTDFWFPLPTSNSGLGVDFALIRRHCERAWVHQSPGPMNVDLRAVRLLAKVRTQDLQRSLERLSQPVPDEPSQSHGLS